MERQRSPAQETGPPGSVVSGRLSESFGRRRFLKLAGVGIAVAALGTLAVRLGSPTTASSLGIAPDDRASAVGNRQRLVENLRFSSEHFVFPPGEYFLDNSTDRPDRGLNPDGYVVIDDFGGRLEMKPGARFVFTDNTRRGLTFYGGKGARFDGLSTRFEDPPVERISPEECVLIERATDTVVRDADLVGSAAAGLLFAQCWNPDVKRIRIRDTMADGLHFANCLDPSAHDVIVDNTGDDGLAFVNYQAKADDPAHTGGRASNITVTRSRSRGIAVIGQSGVTVDGFEVDWTANAGIICAQENSFQTRVSSGVTFRNGIVSNGGAFEGTSSWPAPPNHLVNRHGVFYNNVGPDIVFDNITVNTPESGGVEGYAGDFLREFAGTGSVQEPGGSVTLTNVTVNNAPANGFALRGGSYRLDGLTARDVNGTGVAVMDCQTVRYGKLTSVNASRTPMHPDGQNRAFDFENRGQGAMDVGPWTAPGAGAQELHVVDDQSSPTGYRVTLFSEVPGALTGNLGTVFERIAGSAVVEFDNVEGRADVAYTAGVPS